MSSMSNKAAFIEVEKGPIVVRDADTVQPGQGEVLVKVHNHDHGCCVGNGKVADLSRCKHAPFSLQMPKSPG
jgi:Zn-dependent alcohol dehydrogenase